MARRNPLRVHDVSELARGRWRGILIELGVPSSYLSGNHGPCPIERAGRDRFRFDDKGEGMWFCNHCGSGDGFSLLQKVHDWSFVKSVDEVRRVASGVEKSPYEQKLSDERRRGLLRDLWVTSRNIGFADEAWKYLTNRLGAFPDHELRDVRNCDSCYVGPGIEPLPAMIALVRDPNGTPVTLHRTYIKDGKKAEIDAPRRMMPGAIPQGSAVRLFAAGDTLGVAEGIETAIAARMMFSVPVWAALNARMLSRFEPPKEVKKLLIFGDNDENYAGQSAAYELARRANRAGMEVEVRIPDRAGMDWLNVLEEGK